MDNATVNAFLHLVTRPSSMAWLRQQLELIEDAAAEIDHCNEDIALVERMIGMLVEPHPHGTLVESLVLTVCLNTSDLSENLVVKLPPDHPDYRAAADALLPIYRNALRQKQEGLATANETLTKLWKEVIGADE